VLLLSLNGGYVDTMSFLAMHGLFAAHVTGNFVTLGASLALGTTGATAKLLALPVFCLGVVGARLLRYRLLQRGLPVLRSLLFAQFILLSAAAILSIDIHPLPSGDGLGALIVGMTLVSAMAIQNAAHRVHFSKSPPSTLMTGTTTQIMLDVADLLHGETTALREVAKVRIRHLAPAVLTFAVGCAAAATLYALVQELSFWMPPAVALFTWLSAPTDAE
jgi:uncharacterized membrane protein YoaK (UPF0700 family)